MKDFLNYQLYEFNKYNKLNYFNCRKHILFSFGKNIYIKIYIFLFMSKNNIKIFYSKSTY